MQPIDAATHPDRFGFDEIVCGIFEVGTNQLFGDTRNATRRRISFLAQKEKGKKIIEFLSSTSLGFLVFLFFMFLSKNSAALLGQICKTFSAK